MKGKGSKPTWPCVKKELPSSFCDSWQWVLHIALEKFYPTPLWRILKIQFCFFFCYCCWFFFLVFFSINSLFEVMPGLFKFVVSEQDLLVCFSSVLNKPEKHKPIFSDILVQHFLVESRLHGCISHGKSSRSWSRKAAPDQHHTITTFVSARRDETPDCSRNVNFCHSTEYFPQSLGDRQDVFVAKVRWMFVFFVLSSRFCL